MRDCYLKKYLQLTKQSMETPDPMAAKAPVEQLDCKTAASTTDKRPCAISVLRVEKDCPIQMKDRTDGELPRTAKSLADRLATEPKRARPSTNKELPSQAKDKVDIELSKVISECTDKAEPKRPASRVIRHPAREPDPPTETEFPVSTRETTESVVANLVFPDTVRSPDIATQEPTQSAPDPEILLLTESVDPNLVTSTMSIVAAKEEALSTARKRKISSIRMCLAR
jgi:hypothetical protein